MPDVVYPIFKEKFELFRSFRASLFAKLADPLPTLSASRLLECLDLISFG